MNRTPVADWQQLSALYELADTLAPDALDAWLEELRAQSNPLLPQLEQMLAARAQVQHNGFLDTRPRLSLRSEPGPTGWANGSGIGPYRLLRKIGSGGMAEVWLAQRNDGAFQRQVAIKLLFRNPGSTERDTFAQRFDRERDILASLNHPHIAGLHDAGVTPNGQPWLALEYVEGQTLTTWCDERKQSVEARVRLFRQVLLAVQHAHANLVIHRDLKPGNILVTSEGEVRLLDFGIAKLMEPEGGASVETELTRMAGRPMTPQYAAPEQLLGQPLTTACDVYSLGVVLYELLCGERPYELKTQSAAQLEQAILETEPRAPSRRPVTAAIATARGTTGAMLHRQLGSDLDAIVLRALAKQPAQRYSSAEAMRADLDRWLAGEPVEACVPSAAYRLRKFTRRHLLAVTLSVGAVMSLIGITAIAVVMGLQAREDSARASAARDFMLGLFKRADQEKARGADITARELLETGRKDVLTRMQSQPLIQAELLNGIGAIQRDMGEYVGAQAVFADAAQAYARLGMKRQELIARSERANSAMRMGDMSAARDELRIARNVLAHGIRDLAIGSRLDEIEGWIAFSDADLPKSLVLFRSSYSQALQAFGPDHVRSIDVLRGQIYVLRQARQFAAALKLLDQLKLSVSRAEGMDATDFAAMARDEGELFSAAGRLVESYGSLTSGLSRCGLELGPNHKTCRALVFSRASVALQLGMTQPRQFDLELLHAIANDRTSPALAAGSLVLLLKFSSLDGKSEPLKEIFERVRALATGEDGMVIGTALRLKAMLALAESRLRVGDFSQAEQWLRSAQDMVAQNKGFTPNTRLVATAKSLQGIALLQRGKLAEAESVLRAAHAELVQSIGGDDLLTRLNSVNIAVALGMAGKRDVALSVLRDSEPTLRQCLGPEAPTYLAVRALVDKLTTDVRPADRAASLGKAQIESRLWRDFFI